MELFYKSSDDVVNKPGADNLKSELFADVCQDNFVDLVTNFKGVQ